MLDNDPLLFGLDVEDGDFEEAAGADAAAAAGAAPDAALLAENESLKLQARSHGATRVSAAARRSRRVHPCKLRAHASALRRFGLQLLDLLGGLDDTPAPAGAAAARDVPAGRDAPAAAPAAAAAGPAGLRVDRGIARRAAVEHVRAVRQQAARPAACTT